LTSIVGKKYTIDVNETRNCLVSDILLNTFENGKTQQFNSEGVVK